MTAIVQLQADKGPPAAPPTRPATSRRRGLGQALADVATIGIL